MFGVDAFEFVAVGEVEGWVFDDAALLGEGKKDADLGPVGLRDTGILGGGEDMGGVHVDDELAVGALGGAENRDEAVERLRITPPDKGTNLYRAFESVATLQPKPDNIVLLVDGLPTMGRTPPKSNKVSAKQRLKLFNRAFDQLPKSIPVNVILFPMEGDPEASSAFWRLAMATRGSFLSPSDDWP